MVCLVVYNSNLRMVASYDSLASSLLPFGLWRGDGVLLDRYARTFSKTVGYSIVRSKTGHLVSLYPPITPLIGLPAYAPALFLSDAQVLEWRLPMEKATASLIAAFSVLALLAAMRRLATPRLALVLALAYAFGTSTWVISSQALWQHGPGTLLLAIAIYLLVDRTARPSSLAALGLVGGLIAANRPMDVFFSIAIAWIVLRRYGRNSWPFFVPAAIVGVAIAFYNLVHFSNLLGGYGAYRTPSGESLLKEAPDGGAFLGLLFSNRGLFTFAPFLLFLFFSSRVSRRGESDWLRPMLFASLGTVVLYSSAEGWSGGYCYGPRYLIICLPALVAALAARLGDVPSRMTTRILFASSVAIAVAVQAIGAYCYPGGDSGNEAKGLWTLRASSPVLAAEAGLQPPDFVPLIAPGITMRAPLAQGQAAASYEWSEPPPETWRARTRRTVDVWIHNEGSAALSSFGRLGNDRAVVIRSSWKSAGGHVETAPPVSGSWVSWRLRPGDTIRRRFEIAGPNVTGRMRLSIELYQVGVGPFSRWGSKPLEADVVVLPGPEYRERRRAAEWMALEAPTELAAGGETVVPVHVRNITPLYWHPGIWMSYRWRNSRGENVGAEGVRTRLPDEARNWLGADVETRVRADVPPGSYQLVFDLVDGGRRPHWFEDDDSPPVSLQVNVK